MRKKHLLLGRFTVVFLSLNMLFNVSCQLPVKNSVNLNYSYTILFR